MLISDTEWNMMMLQRTILYVILDMHFCLYKKKHQGQTIKYNACEDRVLLHNKKVYLLMIACPGIQKLIQPILIWPK